MGRPTTRYFAPLAVGQVVGEKDAPGKPSGDAIREPETRVGLRERSRRSFPPRRVDHRPRDVSTAAEDDVGTPSFEDARACARRAPGEQHRARERERRPARQARDAERVELVARVRNQLRFGAIRRPGERHVDAAAPQLVRDRQRRQHVSCRSPGRDQTPQLPLVRHSSRC